MLKIIGICMIVAAMTAAGRGYAGLIKKRLCSLEGIIELIDALEIKIRDFATPMPEFFKSYKGGKDMTELCKTAGQTGLDRALKACKERLALEDEDMNLLLEFAGSLGTLSAQEEAKRCSYYKEELKRRASEVKENLPVKAGLLKSAGVMCGILAAVLLI